METMMPPARAIALKPARYRALKLLGAAFMVLMLAALSIQAAKGEEPAAAPKPAMWKLEDEDSVIWLFGTAHNLNPAVRWRTATMDAALEEASIFYSEAPVVQADSEMTEPLIMKYGINRSNVPFTEKLSAQGKKDLKQVLASLGMKEEAISQFQPYRPWLVSANIGALHGQKRGDMPDASVDKILWREAVEHGKMLGYFETLEQQFSVYDAMTPEEELKFFEDGLRQLIEAPNLMDEITADWQFGRIEALGDKMNSALEGQESLKDRMLAKRNHAWAEKIAELMAGSGKVFVAVGASHFAGSESVQSHLEELGFTVTRIQ
jgi:uncharacterized protein YbaP (TraB family)